MSERFFVPLTVLALFGSGFMLGLFLRPAPAPDQIIVVPVPVNTDADARAARCTQILEGSQWVNDACLKRLRACLGADP